MKLLPLPLNSPPLNFLCLFSPCIIHNVCIVTTLTLLTSMIHEQYIILIHPYIASCLQDPTHSSQLRASQLTTLIMRQSIIKLIIMTPTGTGTVIDGTFNGDDNQNKSSFSFNPTKLQEPQKTTQIHRQLKRNPFSRVQQHF